MVNFYKNTTLTFMLPEIIFLESEHFEQASKIRDTVTGEAHQWQTYLNALALLGLEEWLREKNEKLSINIQHCSILQPHYANALSAVCNLKVGEFNLCLIATDNLMSESVTVPKAALELPEFAAHLFVLMEVIEEQEQVVIRGVARRDHIVRDNLAENGDWNYLLPLGLFDPDPNHLLFYLRFSDAAAIAAACRRHIAVSIVSKNCSEQLSFTPTELETLLFNLESPDSKIWQNLPWEKGAIALTCPEFLELLYQWQTQPELNASSSNPIKEKLTLLTEKAINVRLWLQDRMDEFAQSLSWVMLPPLTPAFRSRSSGVLRDSPTEQFTAILSELERTKEVEICPPVRGAYQEINLAGIPLQLYTIVWSLWFPGVDVSTQNLEWALLLLIKAQSNYQLPCGITLKVRDADTILVEEILKGNKDDAYLYGHVIGSWDEKFLATLSLPDGNTLTLPPFSFVSE